MRILVTSLLVAIALPAVAQGTDTLALKVENTKEAAGLEVVLFSVRNEGLSDVATVVVTCDGYRSDGSAVETTTAGVYEIAAGKQGLGQAAFRDTAVEKVDCRITTVLR